MNLAKISRTRAEGGYVLIVSLVLLLVLTFMAIGMYHSFRVQENIAANTKEKARAFQVAQSTELWAEYLLSHELTLLAQNSSCGSSAYLKASPATVCLGTGVNILNPSSSNPVMTLANGQVYSTMTPALSISTGGGSGTYYANPQFYIEYLGLSANGQGQIYQITALGYGGNANAVAVVQSIYQLTSGIKNLGGL